MNFQEMDQQRFLPTENNCKVGMLFSKKSDMIKMENSECGYKINYRRVDLTRKGIKHFMKHY